MSATLPTDILRGAAALTALSLLYACTIVGPDFTPPQAAAPSAWAETAKPDAMGDGAVTGAPPKIDDWWTNFHDPVLSSLVERALASNLDVQSAELRIAEARAQERIAGTGLQPSLSGNASYANQTYSKKSAQGSLFGTIGAAGGGAKAAGLPDPYDQFQFGFDASWEPDLFGRVHRGIEAAGADTEASVADANAALVSLEGEVARVYMDLRGAQAGRAITRDNLETQRAIEILAQQTRAAGIGTDIDIVNAAAQRNTTEAQLPLFDRRIALDIDQLSELLAREPGALESELTDAAPVPPVPKDVPIGLPADLIRRRPDISAAEARLHAATARVGVATADLFPRVTLVAGFGSQAEHFPDLANWSSRFLNIGPSLQLPIFDGGRLRATVQLRNVTEKEAATAYAKTVLGAMHEVENALILYDTERSHHLALEATVAENQNALALARDRYKSGVTTFLGVLDAERAQQQSELALADSSAAVSTDLVALYKALGGGWEADDIADAETVRSSRPPPSPP